jgi:ABC-2 type transport system ATP-binding protein/lipopolysaccharide transport system ATP-binding protein
VTDVAISVDSVSKKFRWHRDRRTTVKERMFRGKPNQLNEFWALKDISFEVPTGTTFGLVGHNGSGKSTLLKLLCGIHRPTTGRIATYGRISALLELGAGFHPELTGRENIYLNGAILGLTRKQIDASVDRIIDFSGIGDFVDVPVKVYSSGMYVRLGFSIAVTVNPEILIVDEIVAVGDEEFQRRCFDHLHELHKRGTTIVIVSHSLGIVETLCDQAVWLDHGELKIAGEARSVVRGYLDAVNEDEVHSSGAVDQVDSSDPGHTRLGSGEVRITRLEFLDASGQPVPVLVAGEPATFRLHFTAREPLAQLIFGLGFITQAGVNIAGPNTGDRTLSVEAGTGYVDFHVPQLILEPGMFEVSTGVIQGGHTYDFRERAFDLRVRGNVPGESGLVRLMGSWSEPKASDPPPPMTPASATASEMLSPITGPTV